eukprot:CAMPEP_0113484662 /NCGR_PEP_ID=MMETSP0014_2-20120614/24080_1 /TAXON_ID=2857 /ORGANISM="Nitzschia sp." /LENGTH=460 /DNA_ID=CAMNT_0000378277 /DNA_START=195 /DNA_END=1577 /DNA_ORIENTATION=+ /assembly_acc=CAM_ASM_000159
MTSLLSMMTMMAGKASIGVVHGQTIIEPDELFEGIELDRWGAVIDVRREDEWVQGHIETATFVENLSTTADNAYLLEGCQRIGCEIVVYCRSGARASVAITRMTDELGYTNVTIYNGRGTSQWTAAGYPLVTDESVVPECANPLLVDEELSCEVLTTDDEDNDDMLFNNTTSNNSTNGDDLVDVVGELLDGGDGMNDEPLPVINILKSTEFYDGIQAGFFHAILDVRSPLEWLEGHIEGATLLPNFAEEIETKPDILINPPAHCRTSACSIAVYCNSGWRAKKAINRLKDEFGFTNTQFYNGLGVEQWKEAGLTLVTTTASAIPSCASTLSTTSTSTNTETSTETATATERASPTTTATATSNDNEDNGTDDGTGTEGTMCMSCCERSGSTCCGVDLFPTKTNVGDGGDKTGTGTSSNNDGITSDDPSAAAALVTGRVGSNTALAILLVVCWVASTVTVF